MRLNVNELKEQVKSMDIGLDLVRADGRLGNLVALAVIGDRFAALCQAAKRWHCAVGQLAQNRC